MIIKQSKSCRKWQMLVMAMGSWFLYDAKM